VMLDKGLSVASDTFLPPSDSEEELSIVRRDSIEDLSSTVPRSPRSPRFQSIKRDLEQPERAPSPPSSPRRRLKKKLRVNINGAEFDLEEKRRPLSPFTNGGLLRKLVPSSAPAAVSGLDPAADDSFADFTAVTRADTPRAQQSSLRTTRSERGGTSLMGFLSRRIVTK
jgi:hypothetical protein